MPRAPTACVCACVAAAAAAAAALHLDAPSPQTRDASEDGRTERATELGGGRSKERIMMTG